MLKICPNFPNFLLDTKSPKKATSPVLNLSQQEKNVTLALIIW